MEKKLQHMKHSFKPIYNEKSKILILGSFPSVKSRANNFYYGHPQNRFWAVMATLLKCSIPQTIEAKTNLLLNNRIALYDTIFSCDIYGSADSSIINAEPTDILSIVNNSTIKSIYTNGKLAGKLYDKYQYEKTGIKAINLPSTSAANARYSLDRLVDIWGQML